jgi:hypothetical protein
MEQILAVLAAFCSQNLSNETKRGKRQRTLNGKLYGRVASLSYSLMTLAEKAGLATTPKIFHSLGWRGYERGLVCLASVCGRRLPMLKLPVQSSASILPIVIMPD